MPQELQSADFGQRCRLDLRSRRAGLLGLLGLAVLPGTALALKSGPPRRDAVSMIVIHSTGGPTCDRNGQPIWVPAGELRRNLNEIEAHPKLGVHYMIDRDGTTVASVPEDRIAHHVFRHSRRSIGIELVNDGDGVDAFPSAQIDALVNLLRALVARYRLRPGAVRRHSDLDSGRMRCAPQRRRKVDPGDAFPFVEVLHLTFAAG